VRLGKQNARTVAGLFFRAPGAPMVEVPQEGEGILDGAVTRGAVQIDDGTYTTGRALGRAVTHTLPERQTGVSRYPGEEDARCGWHSSNRRSMRIIRATGW